MLTTDDQESTRSWALKSLLLDPVPPKAGELDRSPDDVGNRQEFAALISVNLRS